MIAVLINKAIVNSQKGALPKKACNKERKLLPVICTLIA